MKERDSNMELLRIVSMMMVLMVHIDGASLGLPDPQGNWNILDSRQLWKLIVESMTIIGVNCFTMISGYYGIRLQFRTLVKFLSVCIFYSVGIYLVFAWLSPYFKWNIVFNLKDLGESFMILSHSDLWYVPAYFGLCLVAPFLNKGCEVMSRRKFLTVWSLFLLFNVWCGWYWGGEFNPTGYTLIQLILVYLTGRLVAVYLPYDTPPKLSPYILGIIYLFSAGGVFLCAVYMPFTKAFAYNSPFVLLESVAFFILFLSFRFKSKVVNTLSSGAFAVYLIHKNPLVWVHLFKKMINIEWIRLNLPEFTLFAFGMTIGVYLICAFFDLIRQKLFRNLFGK